MNELILKIDGLCFNYGDDFSLDNICVDFYKGEKIAILGSNGSGKSTFFLNINGVLKPSGGKIYLNDILITKKNSNELRKNIGIVFQEPDNQMICSTVESEIAFGPLNLGLSQDEALERTKKAMKQMNIEHIRNKPVHYLSGGQKKSVSIADILAMEPQIIIFDEPTASLDPMSCEMFEDILDDIEKSGVTTLISTHDVNFVWRWADRIIVFDDGQIIADDIPEKIFSNEGILFKAKLKKPLLLEISDVLSKIGIIPEKSFLKSVTQMKEILLK